jgi:hypothetical protein
MSRYWVFSWNEFYPSGGFEDFKGWFALVETAVSKAQLLLPKDDFSQVVDAHTGEIVWFGRAQENGIYVLRNVTGFPNGGPN